jgi:hypothetical protein
MDKCGIVLKTGNKYVLTQMGLDQIEREKAKKKSSAKLVINRKITDDEMVSVIPNRKPFNARMLVEPISELKKKSVLAKEVSLKLSEMWNDKRLIRVSPMDQPPRLGVTYIIGLEKDEWICSHCGEIKSANEFDALNWGIAGSTCKRCIVAPKIQMVIKPTIQDMTVATKVFDPMNEISHVMRTISSHTLYIKDLSERMGGIEHEIKELVQITRASHELFSKLAKK